MMEVGAIGVLTVLGLAVGSFLNVCIHRLPLRQSVVTPSSRCPACGGALRWSDNIPVLSYLWLRGRCRTCDAQISPVYPLVELSTAVVFVLQYQQLGWQPLLAVRLLFGCAMIVLFVIDLRHRILPNAITIPGIVVGLAAALAFEPGWRSALAGVVIGGGGSFLLAVFLRFYSGLFVVTDLPEWTAYLLYLGLALAAWNLIEHRLPLASTVADERSIATWLWRLAQVCLLTLAIVSVGVFFWRDYSF